MEAPARILRRKTDRSKRCKIALGAIIFVVILAIIVPLAVLLPRKKHSNGLKSTVIVPLYIYPVSGAWDPLYDVVTSHPHLNFTAILNPESGPGSTPYPNDDYTSQIQKLNTYPNVRTIGYVRTNYGARNITSVLQDVSTYSGWASNTSSTGLAVHGIFFDEVTSEYSPQAADYLETINQAVKDASGLLPDKMVIHNPGTIPDVRFTDPRTDVTIVFEESYQLYKTKQAGLEALTEDRSRYSYVIHSVPTTMSEADLRSFADTLSRHAESLFLTDLDKNYYESFGPNWRTFIDVMPT